MLYYMNWLAHDFWTRTGGWEFDHPHGAGTSSPSHWQQVEEQAPKPVGRTMCFLLMTLVPVQELCANIYIYIYMLSLYKFCYRTYIYIYIYIIYIYNGSAIQYWRSCTPSRSIGLYFWGVRGSWAECHFLFSFVYQLSCALWLKSNIRMLVTFSICFRQHFDTRYLVFYSPSPPRMFCPWTFFENIGFNTVLTDPFISHLATQLGYSAGEFQTLQLIVLAAFGVVD